MSEKNRGSAMQNGGLRMAKYGEIYTGVAEGYDYETNLKTVV